ncbi:MAG: Primosomal protein N' [Candidatus Magasanikbacteria bacterium GW2011_GWA2_56_11]|uniref:Primosomal protein N n=1 Tax=Candidatus Magasanikbacteria bacterium GW2011_GWA2_56_11 TaxID=1619044 RepID=A0A0G2AL65_9BACT|nr:MAG: Primosomal protein N' [Candidatus Magasanikbacteria bacterium GW2011_GWA2_56_11]
MFAEIIPLARLPKTISSLDYALPLDMAEPAAGQLVRIPFRRQEILGLVRRLKAHSAVPDSRPLLGLACPGPLLLASELENIDVFSRIYGVSPSVFAKMYLPPLQKAKLRRAKLTPRLERAGATAPPPAYVWYRAPAERLEAIAGFSAAPALVLVPEARQIQELRRELTSPGLKILTWSADLTPKEQFERWYAIARGEFDLIIGTRDALFLPVLPYLATIVIDHEHSPHHKNWDQTPRWHAKHCAQFIARQAGISYVEMSYSPSFSSYFSVHKGLYAGSTIAFDRKNPDTARATTDWYGKRPPEIVHESGRPRPEAPYHPAIELALSELGADSGAEDAIVVLNRRGFDRLFLCRDCGHTERCPECGLPLVYEAARKELVCYYNALRLPVPLVCARCRSPLIIHCGAGLERVEAAVKTLVEPRGIQVIRVEAGRRPPAAVAPGPRVLVGTDAVLAHIHPENTRLIALLDADMELAWPDYTASESAWHRIQEIQYRKHPAARLIIPTRRPDHLVFKSLLDPERLYRTELNYRRSMRYPPYNFLVRYLHGDPDKRRAETAATELARTIERTLTDQGKTATLNGPFALQPAYLRRAYWYGFVIKLNRESWYDDVMMINNLIPPDWKVDPDPLSILSS